MQTNMEKLTTCFKEIGVKFSSDRDPVRHDQLIVYLEDEQSTLASFTFTDDGKFLDTFGTRA